MSKKLMTVTVHGKQGKYCFPFYGDPKNLEGWRNDGLEIDEICNTFPEWVVDMGLARPWAFMQDLFNFKNPFKRD